ncbi:MAG TPA: TlpA disulfide reductase family protein [Flavilitoribacter sp.]|nr:TlpA disulfide reductase family protein [Flavilitoribacter sp.]HMQ87765.1 TlpA disulfide reductase family protein [Flavilitoribacter sp.]
MKPCKVFYTLVLSFFVLSLTAQNRLPDAEIKTLEGQTVNLADYGKTGKVTIISLWATWCTPCKKELDAIAELYPEWVEKYGVEYVAITIDTQRQLAKVKPMVETKGWEYTILSDANNILGNLLNFQTIPQTFLLNKQGEIVFTHSGYVPGDEYELEEKIKSVSK